MKQVLYRIFISILILCIIWSISTGKWLSVIAWSFILIGQIWLHFQSKKKEPHT